MLGLDRAPEVNTIRLKLAELGRAGKAADLIMALAVTEEVYRHQLKPVITKDAGEDCAA